MKIKKLVKKEGITLIALVITILILLILAGITTTAITGENGLLNSTLKAKEQTEIANEKEILEKATVQSIGDNKYGNIERNQLQDNVDNIAGENNCEISEAGDEFRAHFNESGRWYNIDKDGNINEMKLTEETDGIYIADKETKTLTLDGAILFSPIPTLTPSTQTNLNYIWTSSNPSIATVTSDGIVICGTEIGTTTITCKGANTESSCKVTTTAQIVYTNNTTTNITINGNDGNWENPTIPVGFSAITTLDATWNTSGKQTSTDSGLVIMDNRGNQFVWVPVPNVVYDGTTTIESGSYTPMAEFQSNSNTNYKGIFYQFDGTTATRNDISFNEPAVATKSDYILDDETKGLSLIKKYILGMENNTDDEIKTQWANQLQKEYNELIKSVQKYEGFWISRYEASYDINYNKLSSIAGAKSATANDDNTKTWYGLYQKIKDFSKSNNYKSIMLYGSQYLAMSNWMARCGIPVGARRHNSRGNIKKYK